MEYIELVKQVDDLCRDAGLETITEKYMKIGKCHEDYLYRNSNNRRDPAWEDSPPGPYSMPMILIRQ
jgi:hypothetical protein